ncbi:MAG TPA: hypothetical protein VFP12_10200 [Allosphingosinicella sp.]|nr:hypothetical protein [Allosphingosinicella sp.]
MSIAKRRIGLVCSVVSKQMSVKHAYCTLGVLLLASCSSAPDSVNREDESPPANVSSPDPAAAQPSAVGTQAVRDPVPLIFNERSDHPLPLALQMGTLGIEGTCLVFKSGERRSTPVWPAGTRWAGTAERPRIRLPNGTEFELGATVNLPGGLFGRPGATDLRLSAAPGQGCPKDLYAINGT